MSLKSKMSSRKHKKNTSERERMTHTHTQKKAQAREAEQMNESLSAMYFFFSVFVTVFGRFVDCKNECVRFICVLMYVQMRKLFAHILFKTHDFSSVTSEHDVFNSFYNLRLQRSTIR